MKNNTNNPNIPRNPDAIIENFWDPAESGHHYPPTDADRVADRKTNEAWAQADQNGDTISYEAAQLAAEPEADSNN